MPCEDKKPIPGFSGYLASTDGSIWSARRGEQARMGGVVTMHGYQQYTLRKNSREVCRFGHALILETFVGPRPAGYHACHANGDKLDNRLENLRWDTPRGNASDKVAHGTLVQGERQHRAKLKESDVVEMRQLRDKGLTYKELGDAFGVSRTAARAAVIGYSWQIVEGVAPPRRKRWAAGVFVRCSNPGCKWRGKRMAKGGDQPTFGQCRQCGSDMACGPAVAESIKAAVEANMLTGDGVPVRIGDKVWGINRHHPGMFVAEQFVAAYDDPDSVALTYSTRKAAIAGLQRWADDLKAAIDFQIAALATE